MYDTADIRKRSVKNCMCRCIRGWIVSSFYFISIKIYHYHVFRCQLVIIHTTWLDHKKSLLPVDPADISPCVRNLTKREIEEAYEKNTGVLIADYFKNKDYEAVPAVLCKNHGPFTWGKDAHEAVHNAVVLEEVAKMASRCELINPDVKPAPQELQDKHYYRKHGANAYYGQVGQED